MPHVNLTTLSRAELRGLLDSSRQRGDAALSYQILQEMAARREDGGRRSPAGPRVVAVDLGDPLDRAEDIPPMPNWRPPAGAQAEAAIAPDPTPAPEIDDDGDIRLEPWTPARARPPRRLPRIPGAGFALGLVVGAAVAWWVAGGAPEAPAPRAPDAELQVAALTEPVATDQPAVQEAPAAPEPALAQPDAEPPPVDPIEAAPQAAEPAEAAGEEAAETAAPIQQAAEARAPTEARGCAAEPTPADRAICGDPELRRLRDELRHAYAEALDAHEERGLLRQRQLAWRDARNTVSAPDQLATLYTARIRRLNAATAQARSLR